jgi:long-chain acyl-CoA synthetase
MGPGIDITPFLEVKPAPRAVFDRLETHADRPRFYRREGDGWKPYTWGRFAADIRAAASYLADAGMMPGDVGAIYAHNSIEWAVAALAIQSLGGVMVPIYPASTAEQAAYIADHAQARVLFVGDDDLAARVRERPEAYGQLIRTVRLDGPARHQGETSWSEVMESGAALDADDPTRFDEMLAAVDLDQPGMMLYTSGTSGPPKGVPLTHNNVGLNGVDWFQSNQPLLHEDAVDLLWLPLSHIFGFGEMTLGNTLGFTSYMCTPKQALELLPEVAPTVFFSVPAYWEKIARGAMAEDDAEARSKRLAELTGGKLRFCLSGGAGLKREIKELFYENGVLIVEGYGLTETSPTLTINRPDDFRFDSVGKPLPSVQLRLADDGEILAKGPNVFSGYHRNSEATASAFTEDGWFRTGDIGRFTEDGFLQIVDRKKDILVTAGGKNVAPANIELRFRDDPDIDYLVVYGDSRKYLVAGVWPSDEVDDPAAFERHVGDAIAEANQGLARFETIKKFVVIDEPLTVEGGHLTSSLKLRRKAVYETFRDRFEALYG